MRREARGQGQWLKVGRRTGRIAMATAVGLIAFGTSVASAAPPKVVSTSFSHVTADSAVLEAKINPENRPVAYQLEYGPSDCLSSPCTSSPTPEGVLPSATTPQTVPPVTIEGLAPATTYHFRVVTKNGLGEKAEGPDTVFATYPLPPVFKACPNDALRHGSPSALLPDCRAYEQASPVDKNGADINGGANQVQASADGNSIAFFTASGLPGAVGAQDFSTYLARRVSSNWLTRGVYPQASDGPVARNAGWTPDLSLFFSNVRNSFNGPRTFQGALERG